MPTHEMTRFHLRLIEKDAEFHILLVEVKSGEEPKIAAETTIGARQNTMPRFTAAALDFDVVFDDAEADRQRVLDLEDAIQTTALPNYAAFRDADAARGMISDGAYSWLLMNIVQAFDQGSIDIEDGDFVIRGNGKALGPQAARGGAAGGKGADRARPKRAKKLTHSWF